MEIGETVTYYPHDGSTPVDATVTNVLSTDFVDITLGNRTIERVQVAFAGAPGSPDTHFCSPVPKAKKGKSTEAP